MAIWLLTATFYVLAAALLPFRWAVAAWLALVVVETLVVVGQNLRGTKFDRLPVHVEHMAERFGLWVMLVQCVQLSSQAATTPPSNSGTPSPGAWRVYDLHGHNRACD